MCGYHHGSKPNATHLLVLGLVRKVTPPSGLQRLFEFDDPSARLEIETHTLSSNSLWLLRRPSQRPILEVMAESASL